MYACNLLRSNPLITNSNTTKLGISRTRLFDLSVEKWSIPTHFLYDKLKYTEFLLCYKGVWLYIQPVHLYPAQVSIIHEHTHILPCPFLMGVLQYNHCHLMKRQKTIRKCALLRFSKTYWQRILHTQVKGQIRALYKFQCTQWTSWRYASLIISQKL